MSLFFHRKVVAFTALAALALGSFGLHVYADGAPTVQPLWYSGSVTDSAGTPLTGNHQVWVRVYREQTGANAALCATGPTSAPFNQGRFRVEMSSACIDLVKSNPDLFVELSVDDDTKPFPRSKIGAVPYALEAGHAVTASQAVGALKQSIDAMPKITAWTSFAPALFDADSSAVSTSGTSTSGSYRRVGDSIEAQYYIDSTQVFAGKSGVRFGLPAGLLPDQTKIAPFAKLGFGNWNTTAGNFIVLALIESTTNLIRLGTSGTSAPITPTSPADVAGGGQVAFTITVPVKGWTLNSP